MRPSLSHKIESAKQDRTSRASVKESHLQEALNQLVYFQYQSKAIEAAIKRMQDDLKVCQKQIPIWESRIKKLRGSKDGQ